LEQLRDTGWLPPGEAFGLTPQWCAQFDDQDPEVLADELLQVQQSSVVVVAETSASLLSGSDGKVAVDGAVPTSAIRAVFVRVAGSWLWFGPTELEQAVAAAE
jgi:hypothetical protein